MCDEILKDKLKYIKKQFLCGVPLKEFVWNGIISELNYDEQETLIKETVDNVLILEYPLKISYQREFIRKIIDQLEKQEPYCVHDSIYDAFGRLVSLPEQSDKFYKHYLCPGGKVITLNEKPSFISSGTTGLCTWTASLALSDWCLENSDIIQNKTILELGSGVGLTGLTIAQQCSPSKVYLTDCHEAVLSTLNDNILLNPSPKAEVLSLPWEDVTPTLAKNLNVDVVLAADVVYDPDLFDILINAINNFLQFNMCKAIIACTERNTSTLNEFLSKVGAEGIEYEELPQLKPNHLIWSTNVPVRLFTLQISK